MELDRYAELLEALRRFRKRFADSIRSRIQGDSLLTRRAQSIHRGEGVGEAFSTWLDRFARRAAINFILKVLFLRVLEDQQLLRIQRIRGADSERMWDKLGPNLGPATYLEFCFRDAAYALPDLFEKTTVDLIPPDDQAVRDFLNLWREPDPDRPGWLRFDFRGEGFNTRFIGDVYQHIDEEAREYYALLQTPDFISQFLLQHTLLKRFQEKDFEEVTLIDPTSGSGHLLLDAFKIWRERYAERYPDWTREKIFRTIVERHLFGADINEYACALARFRLLIEGCNWSGLCDISPFRDLRFHIVCCDSLIPYEKLLGMDERMGSQLEEVFGAEATRTRAVALFSRRYDVAVGNPPYISPKDSRKRELYREWYVSAYGKYGLAAPFVERFLGLVTRGGQVGLINSNAFARRQYGSKLIEEVLPHYDLEAVIDLSGAYIPGHGTPTLILFGRNQPSASSTVIVVSNLKGEPGIPADPAQGKVWQSVVRGFSAGAGYTDEYVDVAHRLREALARHPWQFGDTKSRLYDRIKHSTATDLDDCAESIGITLFTLTDDVYVSSPDFARRCRFSRDHLRQMVIGEALRDWTMDEVPMALFPYEEDFRPFDIDCHSTEKAYLESYREVLANTYLFGGKTKVEGGYQWFEYGRLTASKYLTPGAIALPEIGTHNHAFLSNESGRLFKHSAQVIKLQSPADSSHYMLLTSMMNTSTVCFCLKQVCFNKGAGDDPVRDRYVYAGNYVGLTPIPRDHVATTPNRSRMLALAEAMIGSSQQLPSLAMQRLFEKKDEAYHTWNVSLKGHVAPHPGLPAPFSTAHELRDARDKAVELRREIRQRMIFLQEEMDWLAYAMYGLLGKVPLAEDYLTLEEVRSARLELGQRAFEEAGRGYKGDWPKSWHKGARGYLPGPAAEPPALCASLQRLIRDRVDIIASNADIALLEDPLYKRRWVPPNCDQELQRALELWLREMAEYVLEQAGRPLSLREWTHGLSQEPRILAAAEVYTGTPMFDLGEALTKVLRVEAVPDRPEDYLKPTGLDKLRVGRRDFKADDFAHSAYWAVRGKLNIPRERYIEYREMGAAGNGTYYGWAGWGSVDRAKALAYLLEQAMDRDLTDAIPRLRESLRDLLPALRKQLEEWQYAEFEALAR